jgi:predicted nucleotidyltransferase component of viral defense system
MADTKAQVIELFHLAFLNVLPSHVRRDNYIVKGGVNLRYFYGSVRYSEDIDFDAQFGERWKMRAQVDAALESKALSVQMRPRGITIANINMAKDTDTTQRWKLLLAAPGHRDTISTKVEFSRRNGDTRYELETVPRDIVRPYGLLSPSLQRYLPASAIEQKIAALALRSITQARDVFDLDHLFRTHPDALALGAIDSGLLATAIDHCIGIDYDAFSAQVIPFLDEETTALYGAAEAWEQMKESVVDHLSGLDAHN